MFAAGIKSPDKRTWEERVVLALSPSEQGSHGGRNLGQLVILGPSRKETAKNASVNPVFCFVCSLDPSSENGAAYFPTTISLIKVIPHRHAHRAISQVTP